MWVAGCVPGCQAGVAIRQATKFFNAFSRSIMSTSSRQPAAEAVWSLIAQRVQAGAYDSLAVDDLARRLVIAQRYVATLAPLVGPVTVGSGLELAGEVAP